MSTRAEVTKGEVGGSSASVAATRIGIDGFCRLGRMALRAGWSDHRLEFTQINEPTCDVSTAAGLLGFDTIRGRWTPRVFGEGGVIDVDDKELRFSQSLLPERAGWVDHGVEIVLDCTDRLASMDWVEPYFNAGVKKVIAAGPAGRFGPPLVFGWRGLENRAALPERDSLRVSRSPSLRQMTALDEIDREWAQACRLVKLAAQVGHDLRWTVPSHRP